MSREHKAKQDKVYLYTNDAGSLRDKKMYNLVTSHMKTIGFL